MQADVYELSALRAEGWLYLCEIEHGMNTVPGSPLKFFVGACDARHCRAPDSTMSRKGTNVPHNQGVDGRQAYHLGAVV